jgi:acetyltransferase-like isoleucine patch superfamily enzyme
MGIIFNLQKLLCSHLANLEFELTNFNGGEQFFRKKHFQLMGVKFNSKFYFGKYIDIRNKGNLSLGERCCIGSYSRIWNYAPITIADDFLTAGCLTLNSATHDPITLEPKGMPIQIGSRVWCGINVTIIGGVTIGDDVVIGAGSVVVKDIPSQCIAVGVPAKKIKDLDRQNIELWKPYGWN